MNSSFNSMLVIMRYTLRESLKNRILWLVGVFAVIGIAGATFAGDYSIVEHEKTEVALLASFYRFCAVFFMIILVVSTMVREFNDKCLELYLSLPISRLVYFTGKLAGFFITGMLVAAIYAAVLAGLYTEAGVTALWFLSLVCELIIMISLAYFCVMTFNQQIPASVATAFFFYLMARASDTLALLAQSELIIHTTGASYLSAVMTALTKALPSLGRFTDSEWLMYGGVSFADVMPLILLQTVIYATLLAATSFFDFHRKNL